MRLAGNCFILYYIRKEQVRQVRLERIHGNQFSKTSQILEESSKQSSIILDIALFDEILTLYCFSRLMENFRSRFKFCWIVLFLIRQ